MKIGILSRRETGLAEKLKIELEKRGNTVSIYTHKNLIINEGLLINHLFILKSKKEEFLYAAFYIESNGIPVFPDPCLAYKIRHKIQAHHIMKKHIGLLCPNIFVGTFEKLQSHLKPENFPLVIKPLMGSESMGVKVINSLNEIENHEDILYLEKFIEGHHYNVQFLEDEICLFEKVPFQTAVIKPAPLTEDIKNEVIKLRKYFKEKLFFGHLDIIRESSTGKIYTVDIGTFPQFSSWKAETNYVQKVCKIILNQVSEIK